MVAEECIIVVLGDIQGMKGCFDLYIYIYKCVPLGLPISSIYEKWSSIFLWLLTVFTTVYVSTSGFGEYDACFTLTHAMDFTVHVDCLVQFSAGELVIQLMPPILQTNVLKNKVARPDS